MNVKISKVFRSPAILVPNDYEEPLINFYTIMLHMVTVTEDGQELNCAFDRVKYWINNVFQDCVLIRHDSEHLTAWQNTNMRVLVMPDGPIDQLVGIMLACKLTAIAEGRITFHDVSISSTYEDDMTYSHHVDEAIGPFAADGWWNDHRPVWRSKTRRSANKDKVINLARWDDWKSLDLDWQNAKDHATIVFAEFPRDDT